MNKDLMELSQEEFNQLSRMRDTGGRYYCDKALPKPNVFIDTEHVDVDQLDLHPGIRTRDYTLAYEIYNGMIPQDLFTGVTP